MNTKRIIVLGFALVAASAAALLARSLMGGGTPKVEAKIGPPAIAMSEVLVATSNVQPGLALVPDMVKWQRWPANAVDASFITHTIAPNLADALKNTVVRVPLYAGQPITSTSIVHGDTAGFMAAQLQPGMRAVSIVISVESGAGGFILPNDRIDLLLTTKTNENPPHVKTKTILGNVRVLAVDQTFKDEKDTKTVVGKTATLELTPSQGELVAAAQTTGTLSLSLRGLGDNQVVAGGRSFNGDEGLVSIIKYGVLHSGDNDSTVQGARERAQ
ncbi:MAG TPA: Flp pilus assembly protein CpaB [Rhizomicrobium sp.]|jgi:pilus assembly protein CpaB|nr:Flp pilus assembly protein CpaB [Rhizomicrobium sp.]